MRHANGQLSFSATDLSRHLVCTHLTSLRRAVAFREIDPPPLYDDPRADVLRQRGIEHEQRLLDRFAEERRIVETIIPSETPFSHRDAAAAATRTREAMSRGANVIYQGRLEDDSGRWSGYPDFLLRVDRPSALGGWSYEVLDTKLARRAKGEALLQLLLYSDLLAQAQGIEPERMHLALGGGGSENPASFRVAEYAAYYRAVRRRFEAHAASPPDTYPEPVEHCGICEWQQSCAERRRTDDHLSLVAGITRGQRSRLVEQEVTTMAALGALRLPVSPRLDGIGEAALARIREQARVQDQARREGRRIHELVTPVEPDKGLAALPEPSDGDVFFDLEGDAFAADGGLEYLFGVADRDGNYNASWGARPGEREARVRALHRQRHGALGTASRLPHLSLRRLRDHRRQAPDEPLRDPRGRGRPAAARPRVRRPPSRGPAGVARLGRELLDQEAGAVLRLRSRGGPDHGDAGAHSGRGAARVGRCGRCPGPASDRDRGLQPGRLPLDAAPRRVASPDFSPVVNKRLPVMA